MEGGLLLVDGYILHMQIGLLFVLLLFLMWRWVPDTTLRIGELRSPIDHSYHVPRLKLRKPKPVVLLGWGEGSHNLGGEEIIMPH